jgi:hypothetical protein
MLLIEARANEILGPISSREDVEFQERLSGTRDNQLFFFFGIHIGDHGITIGCRTAQAKCAVKGGQRSSEAAAPSAHTKAIRKHRGRGTGWSTTKYYKSSRVATSEVVSSSPEESNHSKSDTETHPSKLLSVLVPTSKLLLLAVLKR